MESPGVSFLQLGNLFPGEQQRPTTPESTGPRRFQTGLEVGLGSNSPLGLLQFHSHSSVLTPLLFHILRLVSSPRRSLPLVSLLLHYIISGLWAHQLRGLWLTLPRLKSRFKSDSVNIKSATAPDPSQYQDVPEAAAGALAGGCGGFACAAPHHGGSSSTLAQGDRGRAVFEDVRAAALPGAVLDFLQLRQRTA